MFSEEAALRTIIIDICTSKACKEGPTGASCLCDMKTQTKFFALDDDFSYIAIKGDETIRKDKSGLTEGDVLWAFDEKTGVLRRQSSEEALVSLWRLTDGPKKFLCESDKPSYMKVVNYSRRDSI